MLRALFDKNVPYSLKGHLADYQVETAEDEGWGQISNGELISHAEAKGYQIMLTCDQNIQYQQNFAHRKNLNGRPRIEYLARYKTENSRDSGGVETSIAGLTRIHQSLRRRSGADRQFVGLTSRPDEATSGFAILLNWIPSMKVGVVVFPGSNCDHDAWYAINRNLRGDLPASAEFIWHDSTDLSNLDAILLPGGFSYGDYLRCGAIARFSPVMNAVKKFAAEGGLVIGVCNGFQILVEAGLLPGALLRNQDLKFICREVTLRAETADSPFTSKLHEGQLLHLPIAHGEGRYFADEHTLDALEAEDRIAFRYVDNPNGSIRNIAGVLSRERNVMGLMPHPERACDPLMGSTDGLGIFESVLSAVAVLAAPAPALTR